MRYFILYFTIISLCIGCTASSKKEEAIDEKKEEQILSQDKITHSIGEVLIPEASKLIENWQEYKITDELITEYYTITPSQALQNAQNLANAAQQLKDSIRIEKFNSPDIKIRLNVFYNNTQNLNNLNTITNLDNELLKREISNVLSSFSAINSKVNNLVQQEILERELIEFNHNNNP